MINRGMQKGIHSSLLWVNAKRQRSTVLFEQKVEVMYARRVDDYAGDPQAP